MSGQHRVISRADRLREAFSAGLKVDGWRCRTCEKGFDRLGRSNRATFGRFVAHLAVAHRRLPDVIRPSGTWTTVSTWSTATGLTFWIQK